MVDSGLGPPFGMSVSLSQRPRTNKFKTSAQTRTGRESQADLLRNSVTLLFGKHSLRVIDFVSFFFLSFSKGSQGIYSAFTLQEIMRFYSKVTREEVVFGD